MKGKTILFLAISFLFISAVSAQNVSSISQNNITKIAIRNNTQITAILPDNLNGQVYVVATPLEINGSPTYLYDIDGSTLTLKGVIKIPGLQPGVPVVDPASGNLYLLDIGDGFLNGKLTRGNSVYLINTSSFTLTKTISVIPGAVGLGISNINGKKLLYVITNYVSDTNNTNATYVYSATNGLLLSKIPLGGISSYVFSTANGKYVYAVSYTSQDTTGITVYKISSSNNTVTSQNSFSGLSSNTYGKPITSVMLNGSGTKLYFTIGSYVFLNGTYVLLPYNSINGFPPSFSIAGIDSRRNLLYILSPNPASSGYGSIYIVNLTDHSQMYRALPSGIDPIGVGAFDSVNDRLYFANENLYRNNGNPANATYVVNGVGFAQQATIYTTSVVPATTQETTIAQQSPSGTGSGSTLLYLGTVIVIILLIGAYLLVKSRGKPPKTMQEAVVPPTTPPEMRSGNS